MLMRISLTLIMQWLWMPFKRSDWQSVLFPSHLGTVLCSNEVNLTRWGENCNLGNKIKFTARLISGKHFSFYEFSLYKQFWRNHLSSYSD
jgi:hypothetical protein